MSKKKEKETLHWAEVVSSGLYTWTPIRQQDCNKRTM